MATLVHPERF
jgi:hypothetical protein